METINENFVMWITNPTVRLSLLLVGLAILLGFEFFNPLVRRRYEHASVNLLMSGTMIIVNLLFSTIGLLLSDWVMSNHVGLFHLINVSTAWMVVISIIFLDLWAAYFSHTLFHRYEWLWRFHVVHHADKMIDVTTAFRQHPIESVFRITFYYTGMIILGVPVWVVMTYLALSAAWAQLEHSNIRIPARLDRILQYVVVTPYMHKVHHSASQPETDSNFSNILSVWDRLFGTYHKKDRYDTIEYGLGYIETGQAQSFWSLLKLPFLGRRTSETAPAMSLKSGPEKGHLKTDVK